MSFILDALKKSESERQRQNGPALFEVKIAPPRHRFAIWAAVLGALLAINLGVVGWMLAHHTPAQAGEAGETASASTAPASGPVTGPASAPVTGPAARPAAAARPQEEEAAASAPESLPPGTAGATGTSTATGAPASAAPTRGRRALLRSAAGTAASTAPVTAPAAALAHASPDAGAETPAVAAPRSAIPQGPGAQQSTPLQDNGGSVVRESDNGLPTYQELASQPDSQLPQLELDLHVYSPQPDQRFVFLNMTKLREGDSLPQGVRVDTITPSGVILSYRGKRFVLQR